MIKLTLIACILPTLFLVNGCGSTGTKKTTSTPRVWRLCVKIKNNGIRATECSTYKTCPLGYITMVHTQVHHLVTMPQKTGLTREAK